MLKSKLLCAFAVTMILASFTSDLFSQKGDEVAGIWAGKATINADISLNVVFEIFGGDGQSLSGLMHSVDQKAFDIPVKEVIAGNDTVKFLIPSIKAVFSGEIKGDSIRGSLVQGKNNTWPLNLARYSSLPFARPGRPQEPSRPLPYYEESITYDNESAGVTIAGTFTRPSAEGKYAAVILISGSGPNDRDESIFGHKVFLVLSDQLTRAGFAVLRVDDRGIGESTGNFPSATVMDLASDVIAGVEYLSTRPDVNRKKIGLIGHSLGGEIAPVAATMSKDVAFIVMMAGASKPLYQVIYEQCDAIFTARGISREATEVNRKVLEAMYETIISEKDSAVAMKAIRQKFMVLNEEVAQLTEAERKQMDLSYPLNPKDAEYYYRPAKRFDFFYDPAEYLKKVKCPVLALIGSKDIQVLPSNLPLIEENLRKAGNRHYKVIEMEGMNHLFQKCTECTVEEYSRIEETISPEFVSVLTEWLRQTTNPAGK
jgi:pimeloyl-ACP methyl ester carboxylesterase